VPRLSVVCLLPPYCRPVYPICSNNYWRLKIQHTVNIAHAGRGAKPEWMFPWLLGLALLLALTYRYVRSAIATAPLHPVAGQLVVITGAAGGLGRALALEFARRGAVIALWDVRAEALDEVFEWLVREHGVRASSIHSRVVDVTDAAAVASGAQVLRLTAGSVDIVVSNAAVVGGERLLDANEQQLQAAFEVNVLSHVWTARAFLSQMLAPSSQSTGGVLVTVGSLMGELPAARLADYCAGKAALAQLHECLRWELKAHAGLTTASRARPVHCLHVQPYMIDERDTPLFAGGTPLRYPWLRALFPPLRAATVAHRIVNAVEARYPERLYIPSIFQWLPVVLQLLPAWLRDVALEIAGAGCAMDGFEGRHAAPRVTAATRTLAKTD
jgi:all-trans-retinol dehydrogenase (NAD+)